MCHGCDMFVQACEAFLSRLEDCADSAEAAQVTFVLLITAETETCNA